MSSKKKLITSDSNPSQTSYGKTLRPDLNLEWQKIAARASQPSSFENVQTLTPDPSSTSLTTFSDSTSQRGPASNSLERSREVLCHGPEVVYDDPSRQQAGQLEPWSAGASNSGPSPLTEATESATPLITAPPAADFNINTVKSFLGPAVAKIGQIAQDVLSNTQSNVGIAILISITLLSLATLYMIYSVIYSRMGYILVAFLSVVGLYAGRQYLVIAKQAEVQLKAVEVDLKRVEVERQWISEIGSKLKGELAFDGGGRNRFPVQGRERRALMPAQFERVEEVLD
ncbi:hypothetical protein G7Y89_g4720 [Cudoniella acicularis]|uniref:Uncharacterized protein n=1 Tax=Cudoniella acicularis TaxID=354080 RepID=A0A8H4W6E7_9HELO|nr:hypothetical protein G7Y89_g4720 [Cudoniella acicularis]